EISIALAPQNGDGPRTRIYDSQIGEAIPIEIAGNDAGWIHLRGNGRSRGKVPGSVSGKDAHHLRGGVGHRQVNIARGAEVSGRDPNGCSETAERFHDVVSK